MITKSTSFLDELALGMSQELQPSIKKQAMNELPEAAGLLYSAMEIFEAHGLTAQADKIMAILEKIAHDKKAPECKQCGATMVEDTKTQAGGYNCIPCQGEREYRATMAKEKAKKHDTHQAKDPQKIEFSSLLHNKGEDKLKKQWLDHIGYMVREDESPAMAFDRLRVENPDFLPAPRQNESLWDAIRQITHGENTRSKDELVFESYQPPQGPIHSDDQDARHKAKQSDPHTKGLTPEKMTKNLKDHGTVFNLSDDGRAEDLLNLDVNDADPGLEVVENDKDFEEEK